MLTIQILCCKKKMILLAIKLRYLFTGIFSFRSFKGKVKPRTKLSRESMSKQGHAVAVAGVLKKRYTPPVLHGSGLLWF